MKLTYLGALLWGSIVTGQNDYPNLPVSFLQTSDPVTALNSGYPWGTRTANNTNPYENAPNTFVIRKYDFTVKRAELAPDGVERSMLLVNGQFPGPLIEANWGDTIQVTVHNEIDDPEEGLAFHWHGLLQKKSQWMDGVPGIQQCPIPPGSSFTYQFIADLYGTTWYHSHYSAQYAGGIFGPLIIHGPATVPYDIDIGPILLTDYYHDDYFSLVEQTMSRDTSVPPPFSDNNLINGRNNFDCSTLSPSDNITCTSNAGLSKFQFTPGKSHRLRLINAGAEGIQKFSLDGHTMTVIANDFVPVLPYQTKVVTLGVGQRTDVIIQAAPHATGSYWMRSSITTACSLTHQPNATAIVYYGHETTPQTQPWPAFVASLSVCENDDLTQTIPWFPIPADPNPATTQTIDIQLFRNESNTGPNLFWMNNSSFRADYNTPILLLSKMGNNSYPDSPEWNVYNFGSNSSIRIILINDSPIAHPIHLHGHNYFVENVGATTQWDGTVVRPLNPQRRDVQILPIGGYLVMQITADNPGVWPLHCHIAWHVSAGFYVTVMERPDDIANLDIPSVMAQTCRDWASFTNTTIVDQIDSGL